MNRSIPDGRLDGLMSDPSALSDQEADLRRLRFGENTILPAARSRLRGLAVDTARDPMVWFLLLTALVFAWTGDRLEAAILGFATIPVVGMDAFLHWRTQASAGALRQRLAATARVVRSGLARDVATTDLVPGDLVLASTGDWLPADGLIESSDALQVDESTLTGEAMPVSKRQVRPDQTVSAGSALPDEHWVFAGARVLTGTASIRVAFTGADTLYGQIVRSVHAERHEPTPLQREIGRLVVWLLAGALIACMALAATRLAQGHGLLDAVLSAVTLGVAALPEEFPVAFTVFLGVGVYRLAHQRALVRRAAVVENIGRVSCICSDKTGTLTEGRLTLQHILPGQGCEPADVLRAAAGASRPESADPLDLAILEQAVAPPGEKVTVFPFTEARRMEISVRREAEGFVVSVKGAPETVLALTSLPAPDVSAWWKQTADLAESAHKVIACAEQRLESWSGQEPVSGFTFRGLLAFEDPLRPDAASAIADAQAAGIRVIMVTGDHSATARAVAGALGLGHGAPVVIEGDELVETISSGRHALLGTVHVVARATPAQKLALVKWLRAQGEIVAVTGDGVNDAPALRAADIGIAMGRNGAQTSREVASIVLLDDSFDTIIRAIAEGRQLFRNLRLSFAYLLMVHAPLVITAAAIPFTGAALLYLPAHVVWLELIFHPTALLVFQELPADGGRRIGPKPERGFFSIGEWLGLSAVIAIATAGVLINHRHALDLGQDAQYARSAAMATLVFASAAIAAALSGLKTRTAIIAVLAAAGSVLVFIQTAGMAAALSLTPLAPREMTLAALTAAVTGGAALLLRAGVAGRGRGWRLPGTRARTAGPRSV